jgi:hypothetical protein
MFITRVPNLIHIIWMVMTMQVSKERLVLVHDCNSTALDSLISIEIDVTCLHLFH